VVAALPAAKRTIIFVLVAVKAPSVVIPNGKNPRFARRHASTHWTIFSSSADITACKGSFTLLLNYASARGLMTVTSMQKSFPYSQFEINTSASLSSVFAINPTSSILTSNTASLASFPSAFLTASCLFT
jgi:hypothetical protein